MAQRTINQNIDAYKKENPIPRDPADADAPEFGNVDIFDDNGQVIEASEFKEPVTPRSAA